MKTKITTSDIYFAAALVSIGAKIDKENIDRTDPRHIRFTVFQVTPSYTFSSPSIPNSAGVSSQVQGLEVYEDLWENDQMLVNASYYKRALQQIKSLIHSASA